MTKRLASKHKVDRRLKANLWGRPKSPFNIKNYAPGHHGNKRTRKMSDYGVQLQAKQKIKSYYGNIGERQFRNIYRKATQKKGDSTENLIGLLERRLDTVVYRAKFSTTVFAARQLINHGHISVNDRKVNVPSYLVKAEDIIENSIEDFLYASVGNKAITQSDIINEIKIILILTGQSFTEDIKEQLHTGAIQSIIKRNIKKIEIGRYDSLTFNRLDVDKEIEKLADNLSMDYGTLKNTFIANGIDFAHIVDQIETELLWNSLIFELYKDKLTINLNEIDEQLRTIQNKKEINEYLISEIIIEPVPKDELESKIKEIKSKIKTEGFEKVAMNFSISETALKGGNLDWVNENTISEKFKSKIINTPIGNVSEPILLPEGILFFKVRDKRKVKKFENLEEAKNQLVHAEKTKILRMHSSSLFENLRKSITINYH